MANSVSFSPILVELLLRSMRSLTEEPFVYEPSALNRNILIIQ